MKCLEYKIHKIHNISVMRRNIHLKITQDTQKNTQNTQSLLVVKEENYRYVPNIRVYK